MSIEAQTRTNGAKITVLLTHIKKFCFLILRFKYDKRFYFCISVQFFFIVRKKVVSNEAQTPTNGAKITVLSTHKKKYFF